MRPPPMQQQTEALAASRGKREFAFLMEQGTGKSRVYVDALLERFIADEIDGALILSMNGLHEALLTEQFSTHMPNGTVWRGVAFESGAGKKKTAELEAIIPISAAMRILTMNFEALVSEKNERFARRFMQSGKMALIVDESDKIKSPGNVTTRAVMRLRNLAVFRAIGTGTPWTEGPLDLYSQFNVLHQGALGFNTFTEFKAFYAEWKQRVIQLKTGQMRQFPELVRYRNMDILMARVKALSYVKRKDECLTLPPKTYAMPRPITMSKEQRALYDRVKKEILLEFDNREELTVLTALARLTRLHQVANHVMPRNDGEPESLSGEDPKIIALIDYCRGLAKDQKVIIWSVFKAQIVAARKAIAEEFGAKSFGEWHGSIRPEDRQVGMRAFNKDPSCRFFIANPSSAGRGLTLNAAGYAVRLSRTFKLSEFLQAEDRNHRIGQAQNVLYEDFYAAGTVELKIINALREKRQLSELFMKGKLRSIIE